MKNIKLFSKYDILNHITDLLKYLFNKNNVNFDFTNAIKNDDEIWFGIFNDSITPNKYIMLNTEPLNLPKWNSLKHIIKNALFIIDYSYGNENVYKKLNIDNYIILPLGYSNFYEQIYNNNILSNEKSIDLLFYGSITDRRSTILNELYKFTEKNNINFIVKGYLFDYKEKSNLLSKTKIVISIASTEPSLIKTNDMYRLGFLLSNKIFFISEKIGDTIIEDDIYGDYMVYYRTIDELKHKILFFLNNENKRNSIVNNLYDFAKKNYDIEKNFPIDKIKSYL